MRMDRNLSLEKKVSLELSSLRSLGTARRIASIRMMPGHQFFTALSGPPPVAAGRPPAAMPGGALSRGDMSRSAGK